MTSTPPSQNQSTGPSYCPRFTLSQGPEESPGKAAMVNKFKEQTFSRNFQSNKPSGEFSERGDVIAANGKSEATAKIEAKRVKNIISDLELM